MITSPLAQKCCLQKPEGIPYWTKEAQDKFIEISAEGKRSYNKKDNLLYFIIIIFQGDNVYF